MLLRFWQSGWIKFLLSCIIIWSLLTDIMSGEITVFWFLIMTLSLAYLLISQKTILTNRWGGYVDDVRSEIKEEDEKKKKDEDDNEPPGPIGWA